MTQQTERASGIDEMSAEKLKLGMSVGVQLWFHFEDEPDNWQQAGNPWFGQVRQNPMGHEKNEQVVNVMPAEPHGEEPYASLHPRLISLEPRTFQLSSGRNVVLQSFVNETIDQA